MSEYIRNAMAFQGDKHNPGLIGRKGESAPEDNLQGLDKLQDIAEDISKNTNLAVKDKIKIISQHHANYSSYPAILNQSWLNKVEADFKLNIDNIESMIKTSFSNSFGVSIIEYKATYLVWIADLKKQLNPEKYQYEGVHIGQVQAEPVRDLQPIG